MGFNFKLKEKILEKTSRTISSSIMADNNPKEFGEDSSSSLQKEKMKSDSASDPKPVPRQNAEARCTPFGGLLGNSFQGFVPSSPPAFISMEEILKVAEDVSKSEFNMALAHEIAVNSDFKLQQKIPESNIQAKITEIFHKAFWDILQEQLSSTPPDCSQAITLLAEIKEILLSLLMPHSTRLRNEINEVLDVDLVKQQAEKGTIDIGSYAQFIISTMARLCAPARDENIRTLRQLNDVVPLYKGILETLDLMKIDFMNFTLANIRPHIQRHSIEYEKNKFEEILKSLEGLSVPVDGLKFTRMWLQNVYQQISNESNAPEVPNSLILRKAYIKILQWKDSDNFPETLHLDHARFIEMKENLTVMILTASVILVTYSNVGPAIQEITDFKELLKSHIQILLTDVAKFSSISELEGKMETVALQVVKDVNLCLDEHGYIALEEEKEKMLISLIKQISTEEHSVRQLLSKRILEFLELTLHSSTMLKIPPGLSSLQKEVSSFAGQFLSLVRHNTAVFIEYYDRILNELKKVN